jgi:hypothetical protein
VNGKRSGAVVTLQPCEAQLAQQIGFRAVTISECVSWRVNSLVTSISPWALTSGSIKLADSSRAGRAPSPAEAMNRTSPSKSASRNHLDSS